MRVGNGVLPHPGQRGFTLVWVLGAIVVMSLGLAAVGPIWADQVKREREQDLLRFGQLYADAISRYRAASPGSLKQWPRALDDLLLDTRYVGMQRHLRRLYEDPIEGGRSWGLVLSPDGGIMGVYSQSTEQPLRRETLQVGSLLLPRAQRYDQWKFLARAEP